jgi:hypothetical protein
MLPTVTAAARIAWPPPVTAVLTGASGVPLSTIKALVVCVILPAKSSTVIVRVPLKGEVISSLRSLQPHFP